MFKQIKS